MSLPVLHKKRGPKGVSEGQIAEALRKNAGNVLAAANALGISDNAVYKRVASHPELAAIKADAKNRVTEMATGHIMQRIQKNDWPAIYLWMTTQAGWTKRTELSGPGGEALQIAPVTINVAYIGSPYPKPEEDPL